jgi:glucose/arabinose dehydrogenase
MAHRSTLFGFASLTAILVLAGCGGNGGENESGTDSTDTSADSSPTDASASDPTSASQTMTTPTSTPESSDDNASDPDGSTSVGTTSDPDTGSTGDTTTGVPECPYAPVDGMPTLALQLVATGFDRPVLALGDPKQPDRLFVVEQGGNVKILEPGENQAPDDVFLHVDVTGANNAFIGDERGLLGFALHPEFPDDPRVYVAYTADTGEGSPAVTVSEFLLMRGDDNQVDPASERVVIEYDKPAGNHNGGMIGFGPDGYLYIGTGDGGGGEDTYDTGRNPDVILAKVLRIDPEPDDTPDSPVACIGSCNQLGPFDYTIPADNPFADGADATPEVWALGMRNPWRFSWDLETGDLWLADVGQYDYEEIDIISAGLDYGWSAMEGNHCFNDFGCDTTADPNTANSDGLIAPIWDYEHSGGRCSITGGTVYRSCEVPGWSGIYTYGDYCSGELFALTFDGTDVQDLGEALDLQGQVLTGNGWNAWGDSYFTAVEGFPQGPIGDGLVYRLAPE